MKCSKCGTEVESGYLFCPKCLEEVPWVPEYNTLETLQTKKDLSKKKRIQSVKKQLAKEYADKRKRRIVITVLVVVLLLGAFGAIEAYMYIRNNNSYGYQYSKAEEKLAAGIYDEALEYVDRAITLENNHEEAYVLMAQILYEQNDSNGALKVMETALEKFPDSVTIYKEMISIYSYEDHPRKIKKLLDGAGNDVRTSLAEYITPDPEVDINTGTYTHELSVSIEGEECEFYYTLDGTKPSKKASRYDGAISIGEGSTELKVIAYNHMDIPSDIIYRKYTVVIEAPDPPKISPEETFFDIDTAISIEIPEGTTCYYAFDQFPDTNSTVYKKPVNMPEGTHTLYAFLLSANGKESQMASRTYTLIY